MVLNSFGRQRVLALVVLSVGLPGKLSAKRAVASAKNESGELINLRRTLCIEVSPQEPMKWSVFRFKNQLVVHLADITHQNFQLLTKSHKNIKDVTLKLWSR